MFAFIMYMYKTASYTKQSSKKLEQTKSFTQFALHINYSHAFRMLRSLEMPCEVFGGAFSLHPLTEQSLSVTSYLIFFSNGSSLLLL